MKPQINEWKLYDCLDDGMIVVWWNETHKLFHFIANFSFSFVKKFL